MTTSIVRKVNLVVPEDGDPFAVLRWLFCSPSYLLLLLRKDRYLYPQMIGCFLSWKVL